MITALEICPGVDDDDEEEEEMLRPPAAAMTLGTWRRMPTTCVTQISCGGVRRADFVRTMLGKAARVKHPSVIETIFSQRSTKPRRGVYVPWR
jgi:hypothetical protein